MKYIFLFLLVPCITIGQSIGNEVEQLFQKKEYVKAVTILKSHINSNPQDIEALELLGDAYGHQEKWDDAITQYKLLVQKDNANANFHYKYGGSLGMKALSANKFKALTLIGDIKEEFHAAVNLDPNHIEARWALVELYMQLPGIVGGSKKKSLQFAEELQVISPVDGYLAKGYIFEYDDKPQLAKKNYIKAIEIGGSLTCFEKLTNLYKNENQPQKAIQNIEKARDKFQRNALHYQIGKVSADYNVQLDKGEKCLKTYIENYTVKDGVPLQWAYYRLAQIFKHKNDKKSALIWIDKALAFNSDFDFALNFRSQVLEM
ncbi:MAG: tetratricopeptide (TPR) repeat protein [Flavobacteriaceae bacterium]|jgi:tetratricopeptide (TPR) repeat protein|uniref:tetratricopeptide repeat protein n=1 Tax=Candidatus Marifrigoribacter sp. Uisw_064 TaxID=3230970 RepID=UPI003AEB9624